MDKFSRNVRDPELKASHGMTYRQLDDLHHKQQQGDEINKIKGNNDPDYSLPEYESHLYHVSLEEPLFEQHTGRKLSNPRIIKYYPNVFKEYQNKNMFKGSEVKILHDPTKKEEKKKPGRPSKIQE